MTRKQRSANLSEPKRRQADEQEIKDIQNGLPKVIEYWDFVAKEVEELRGSDEDMVKQEMDDLLDKARRLT